MQLMQQHGGKQKNEGDNMINVVATFLIPAKVICTSC